MLLRHSVIYLFARGVPGIIGFITIIIYTRLLSPEAYGQYALVLTGSIIINAILYQWISAALLRFLPQYRDKPSELLSTILQGFILVSFLTGAAGLLMAVVWKGSVWCNLIVVGILLTWAQAWFSINLELVRSRLAPLRYGLISLSKAILALVLGGALIILGLNSYGAIVGLLLAYLVSGLWASWWQ